MLILNLNNETVAGETATDIVTALREGSFFDSGNTNDEYMMGYANREYITSGIVIRTSNEESFLDDLLRHGCLKKLE